MDKDRRIAEEMKKMGDIFKDLDENQRRTAAGLIRSAAFMAVSLEDLEEIIASDGYLEHYENGANQSGVKVSAAVQAYTSIVGRYTTIINRLLKMVPDADAEAIRVDPVPVPERVSKINADAEAAAEKMQAEKARTDEFFKALKAGKVSQCDYADFMAGAIEAH